MKSIILTTGILLGITASAAADDISGSWSGRIEPAPGFRLSIVLNLSKGADGTTEVTLDSPDQGAYGIKGNVDFISADSLHVSLPQLQISYGGSLGRWEEGEYINGTFRQGGASMPLILKPGKTEPNRPQTPKPPFPYTTREVTFSSPEGGCELAGTLTLPASADPSTPVVLMVSGSGLQNRDEEIFGHKPFAVIADYLARIGIASLRYDDRGTGQSTGDGASATTMDFAADAAAGVRYLRDVEKFRKTGVLGHSEGASIAFILASRPDAPDYIIGMGTPAVSGDSILRSQMAVTLGPADVEASMEHIKASGNPWMDFFLAYSPKEDIRGARCPVMALYGELDQQVLPSLNMPEMQRLQPEAEIKLYPSLNHLMQHAQTGSVLEYNTIEETISPETLSDIGRFIRQASSR